MPSTYAGCPCDTYVRGSPPLALVAGTRVRLEYFDQNEAFGRALPPDGVVGTLRRQLAFADGADDWFLLALDQTIVYEGHEHDQLLIRSRWLGNPIGGRERTSVFILLIPDPTALRRSPINSTSFIHVAWGMVYSVDSPNE